MSPGIMVARWIPEIRPMPLRLSQSQQWMTDTFQSVMRSFTRASCRFAELVVLPNLCSHRDPGPFRSARKPLPASRSARWPSGTCCRIRRVDNALRFRVFWRMYIMFDNSTPPSRKPASGLKAPLTTRIVGALHRLRNDPERHLRTCSPDQAFRAIKLPHASFCRRRKSISATQTLMMRAHSNRWP